MKYEKLDKGFKKKWIVALRSGKYKQGQASLKKIVKEEVHHCCLGVAGEICGITDFNGMGLLIKKVGIKGITKVPKQLIGGFENPIVDKLTTMNDSDSPKYSFKRIATWIEKHL